jgi:hypothetical protein
MFPFQHSSARRHRRRSALPTVLGIVIVLVGVTACRAPAGGSAAPPGVAEPSVHASYERIRATASLHAPGELTGDTHGLGVADGRLPDGVTAFDTGFPALSKLDPALVRALRRATTAAERQGVTIFVNSGWRSAAYQDRLRDEAVTRYGTGAEASRWVADAAASPHVAGEAVDVGELDATTWLSQHGATYGLCQVYANEPWHYELRADAGERGCPAMFSDPSHDPRMQQ